MSTVYGKGGTQSGSVCYGLGGTDTGSSIYTIETASSTAWTPVTFENGTDVSNIGGAVGGGAADGKELTIAVRFKRNTDGVFQNYFYNDASVGFKFRSSDRCRIELKNAAGTSIYRMDSSVITSADGYGTLLFSTNRVGTVSHAYFDDTDVKVTPTTDTDDNIDIASAANWSVSGDMNCVFVLMHDSYIDLSVQANRDKFLEANIGTDGSGVFGTAPLVYLTGDADEWNDPSGLNLGVGNNFIMNGAVVNA